jgi:TonB family protein
MSVIRVLLFATYLSLLAGVTYAQENNPDSPSWQRYTVKGEEFSIELPTHPAMTTHKEHRWGNRKDRTERELGAYADGVVYAIYSVDEADMRQALQASIQGITSNPRWDRLTEEQLSVNGFTGKQYFSTDSLGGTVQVFAAKNRVYQFQAFGAKADDPRVKHFFSSLSLGKKVAGTEVSDGPGVLLKSNDQLASANLDSPAKVFIGRDADRKARVVMKPEPAYTDNARKNQITGTVVLRVVFSSDGSVTNIVTRSGLPEGLTEMAIDAARKIKFIPAAKDGKFVSMWMQLEYNFNLY